MASDLLRTRLEIEKRNVALEEELAMLETTLASAALNGEATAPLPGMGLLSWETCTLDELHLLQQIADAVGTHDAAAMADLRDEMAERIAAARTREDVYVELCRDLVAETERLRTLCHNVVADGATAGR